MSPELVPSTAAEAERERPPVVTLLIVIVNYRCAEMTVACLRSLADELEAIDARVIVVDNASGDDSVEHIGRGIETWGRGRVELLEAERNGGFAYGNNLGIRRARERGPTPDLVLLLNPDSEVRPGAVRALLDFMADRPEVGVAGSRLEDPDGSPQHSRFRFSDLGGEFVTASRFGLLGRLLPGRDYTPPLSDQAHEIDWVSGAAMIVRGRVFDSVGLMDERYFLYYEEQDFQLVVRRAGWSIWYVPESRVVHHVSGSTKNFPRQGRPARRPRYWFESRSRFFVKHHGRLYLWATNTAWIAAHLFARLRRAVLRRPNDDPPHLLGDFLRYGFRSPPAPRS